MDIYGAIEAFMAKGYTAAYFEDAHEATSYLNDQIDGVTVGFGDSKTLLDMGLYEKLSSHNEVYDPMHDMGRGFHATAMLCHGTEIFLTSVNAFTKNGELINIDGSGNRVANSLFSHKKVYFVVGINKLRDNLEDGIWRARNIAAPQNAMRLKLRTPCAKDGLRCFDCKSEERICNALVIHLNKMDDMEMEIVIIGENMGI